MKGMFPTHLKLLVFLYLLFTDEETIGLKSVWLQKLLLLLAVFALSNPD